MASFSDGSANAPAGVAQFSNLLSGYAVRPEWKVAGVDYYVGVPSGTALKDPATISMAGVSVNKSTHIVTVTGSNVTLSGYDFGLAGGWQVNVASGSNNVTIQNSHFQVGANNLMPIQAYYGGSINVLNNTFDGGASKGSSVNAMVFTGSGATIEYNRFTNFPNDGIDITRDGNFNIQYNVFDTMGAGEFHTDAIQTYFSAIQSLSIQFNTMYQPPSMSNGGMNAFARIGDQEGNVVHDPVAAYNTIIMASTRAMTANIFQWQGQDGTGTLVNPVIHDNFIDPKGVQYSIIAPMLQDTKGVVNPVTYNNVDMTTGKQLLSGPYNSQTSGIPGKAPAAPVITTEAAASANQVKLTGTATAGATVDIYDQGHLLGTIKASSSGAWTYTTAQLAIGDHSFAARVTDSMSNSSSLSNAWAVTVTSSGTSNGGSGPPPGGGTGTAPGAPVITQYSNDTGTPNDGITSDNTLQLKGTAAPNSTIKVYDGAAQIGQATADASGSWQYITNVLTNATHALKATATNATGQTSTPSAILTVTVDTAAPTAPKFTSDSVVNTNRVQLTGTAEAGSAIKVYDGNTVVGTGTAGANGSWSLTTNALSTGTHLLKATATDAAGNVSGMSDAVDPVIGGGGGPSTPPPPTAPRITTLQTDSGTANDHITNDNTPMLAGTAVANSTVKVYEGSILVGQTKANSAGNWTLSTSALSDGAHDLKATGTDASGNTSSPSAAFSVTIDTHAPGTPTMGVYSQAGTAVGATTNLDDLVVKGTAEANSKVAVFDGSKQIATVTANSAGNWSYDTGHLADGGHSFTAKATDVAGNTSASSAVKGVTVQGAAASTLLEFTGFYENSNHGVTIKGTADAYSLIKLYDAGKAIGTVKADSDGDWTYNSSYLSNKTHTFKAQEVDSSGHVVGSTSGMAIIGSSWGNTLTSSTGNDIFIGNGHPDTFQFAANFGRDVIKDFVAGGRGHDTIQFSKSVFSDFASVLSHASQVGQDVVIAHGDDSLTLKNTKLGALKGYDFHFA